MRAVVSDGSALVTTEQAAGAMASAEEPPADDAPLLEDMEPRTPMKRLGSTRKLAAFNSKFLHTLV